MQSYKINDNTQFNLSSLDYTFGKENRVITLTYKMQYKFLKNLDSKEIIHLGANISYQAKNLWEFIFYKDNYRCITYNANERCKLIKNITTVHQMPYGGSDDTPKNLINKDMLIMRLFFLTLDGKLLKSVIMECIYIDIFSPTIRGDIEKCLENLDMTLIRRKCWDIRHCYLYDYCYFNSEYLFKYVIHLVTPLIIQSVQENLINEDNLFVNACVEYENEMSEYMACLQYEKSMM